MEVKISEKKREANRKNAKKSTGPKTFAGKRYSSRNALRHGLFASQLYVPEEERQVYGDLRTQLMEELTPNTLLELIRFEDVFVCLWKYRQLLRWEQKQIEFSLYTTEQRPSRAEHRPLYEYGDQYEGRNYKQCLYVLDRLKQTECYPRIPEEIRKQVAATLGEEFLRTYEKWRPTQASDVLFARDLTEKAENYGLESPNVGSDAKAQQDQEVLEAPLRLEMAGKIIELQQQHVFEVMRIRREQHEAAAQSDSRFDVMLRLQLAFKRDFYRSLEAYEQARQRSNKQRV